MEYTSFNGEQEVYDMFEYRESSREGVFTEKLETQILDKKKSTDKMTLYHASLKDLDVIKPVSINIGTRISGTRLSSFWTNDKDKAIVWGLDYALGQLPLISNGNARRFITDLDNKKIYFFGGVTQQVDENQCKILELKKEHEDEVLKAFVDNVPVWLYEIRDVPVKKIGRGQFNVEEYTLDEDMKPDKKQKLGVSDIKKFIVFVSYDELSKKRKSAGHSTLSKKESSFAERILFKDPFKVGRDRVNLYNNKLVEYQNTHGKSGGKIMNGVFLPDMKVDWLKATNEFIKIMGR